MVSSTLHCRSILNGHNSNNSVTEMKNTPKIFVSKHIVGLNRVVLGRYDMFFYKSEYMKAYPNESSNTKGSIPVRFLSVSVHMWLVKER